MVEFTAVDKQLSDLAAEWMLFISPDSCHDNHNHFLIPEEKTGQVILIVYHLQL